MNPVDNPLPRLRVRVLVADVVVPTWIALVLGDIASNAGVDLTDVVVAQPAGATVAAPPAQGRGLDAIASLDKRFFWRRVRLLTPTDLGTWAGSWGIDLVTAAAARTSPSTSKDCPDPLTPDVTVDLTGGNGCSSHSADVDGQTWWIAGLPRSATRVNAELQDVTTRVLAGSRVMPLELRAKATGHDASTVLANAVCPVHPLSPLMTGEYLVASARQLLLERLKAAGSNHRPPYPGRRAGDRTPSDLKPGTGVEAKDVATLAVHADSPALGLRAMSAYVGRAVGTLTRRTLMERQWELLVGEQGPDLLVPDPSRMRALVAEPGRYWADPFVLRHEGRTYVFFEEFIYDTRRGRIAVIALDGQYRLADRAVALDLETHLSYPCVFTHDGRVFMVPESADTGTVDLYECLSMPDVWVHRRTLLSGVHLVDPSLVEWQGLWWMFASLRGLPAVRTADTLMLYVSDDPVNGEWRQHPSSPLCMDITNARPAGAPFVRGEKLYRLAQDGSGGYGWAIAVNEVITLTPECYADRRVATVRPGWGRGVSRTHTLNRAGGTYVMDACRYVVRDPRRTPAESLRD